MGLFNNESLANDSPFRTGALKTEIDVIEIVLEWVHWYTNDHLQSAVENQTPEEYEQSYYDLRIGSIPDDAHKTTA